MTADTIYALSSGSPPAAIAVIRISGPRADAAVRRLAGDLPEPRTATLAVLKADGEILDRALVLRFPAPASATGEDVIELHLHGGRAVVARVLDVLAAVDGLRPAQPGEFTRRAFENGRIDLAETEGLADLLEAETEAQRRSALAMAGGALSRQIRNWQDRLLALAARLEAVLDFSDEGEVGECLPEGWQEELESLVTELRRALAAPPAERLRDGIRIVIAGPPNSGKSSLLNHLAGRQAAITSAIAGTTRDLVEAPMAIGGTPFLLVDTAGLREAQDEIEKIGVGRARESIDSADLILWLGCAEANPAPAKSLLVQSKIDISQPDPAAEIHVSAETGEGMEQLAHALITRTRNLLPHEGEAALNARHRRVIGAACESLGECAAIRDFLLKAEALRRARIELDRVTGRAGVENMLDALFGRFCVGK